MPRGKKTTPETVYRIMTSWAVTGNYAETARKLKLATSTVKKVVDENKEKDEFVKLCGEKKLDFAKKATEIIDKGMILLNNRFERALEQEESLDVLIDEIFASNKTEISQEEKKQLVSKIRALQLQDIKAITTAIGTLFDKRALAQGEATSNTSVSITLPEGFDEYAG